MKIIGIDAGFKTLSFSYYEDDKLIHFIENNDKRSISEKFLPMLDSIFRICGIDKTDVDLFVMSSGPSSFTALRLQFVHVIPFLELLNKNVVTVSPLLTMAYKYFCETGEETEIIPLLDAKNDQVFVAKYRFFKKEDGIEITVVDEDKAIRTGEVSDYIQEQSKVITNDINFLEKSFVVNNYEKRAMISDAKYIVLAGKEKIDNKEYENIDNLKPKYLKKSQAEILKEQRG